jgi:hypothetical protein
MRIVPQKARDGLPDRTQKDATVRRARGGASRPFTAWPEAVDLDSGSGELLTPAFAATVRNPSAKPCRPSASETIPAFSPAPRPMRLGTTPSSAPILVRSKSAGGQSGRGMPALPRPNDRFPGPSTNARVRSASAIPGLHRPFVWRPTRFQRSALASE